MMENLIGAKMKNDTISPFNSFIEVGLRCLALLSAGYPHQYDINRIVYYDYFLVHSGDLNGPDSLHPNTPHRSGELLIRRPLLESALKIMSSRELVNIEYSDSGITYLASENTSPFLDNLQASYTKRMVDRAMWVVENFDEIPIEEIRIKTNKNLHTWGGEFLSESIVRGERLL